MKTTLRQRFNWKDLGVGLLAFPPAVYGLIKYLKPVHAAPFIGIWLAILYGIATNNSRGEP